jgi:hypothetical protein
VGTVHEFKRPGESRLHRFEAGFVNLGFLRNAAQSILSGWRTHALFEDVLPEEVRQGCPAGAHRPRELDGHLLDP